MLLRCINVNASFVIHNSMNSNYLRFFYLDPKLFLPFAQILRCNPSAWSTFAILQITNITNFKIDCTIQVIRSNFLCKNENMTLVTLFQIIRDGNCSIGKFSIKIFDWKFWTGYFWSKMLNWIFLIDIFLLEISNWKTTSNFQWNYEIFARIIRIIWLISQSNVHKLVKLSTKWSWFAHKIFSIKQSSVHEISPKNLHKKMPVD